MSQDLTLRNPGASTTDYAVATPGGTLGEGNVAQYGNSAALSGGQTITPAGPYKSQGTNNSIIGTVPPGKTGLPQISTVVQQATDMKVGKLPNNQADNFIASTASKPSIVVNDYFTPGAGVPAMNEDQDPQEGTSLAPQHE
jgi:hypothetical protein